MNTGQPDPSGKSPRTFADDRALKEFALGDVLTPTFLNELIRRVKALEAAVASLKLGK